LKQIPKYNTCFCDTFVNNTLQVLEEIGTEVNIVYFLLWRGIQQHDIQRLIEFQPMPTTTAELGVALFMVWADIAFINLLIHSMARGCVAVFHATAGNTQCLLPFLFLL
jgi:hypothetical protein